MCNSALLSDSNIQVVPLPTLDGISRSMTARNSKKWVPNHCTKHPTAKSDPKLGCLGCWWIVQEALEPKEVSRPKARLLGRTCKLDSCGNHFAPLAPNQLFCTKGCADTWRSETHQSAKYQREYRANSPAVGQCEWCGKDIENQHGPRKYCNDKCRKASRLNSYLHPKESRACECCGKEFGYGAFSSTKKFCNNRCLRAKRKQRYADSRVTP